MAEEAFDLTAPATPMADAYVPAKEPEETFGSDMRGLQDAAKALEEDRSEPETVERKYVQIGGPDDGKDIDPNQTLGRVCKRHHSRLRLVTKRHHSRLRLVTLRASK